MTKLIGYNFYFQYGGKKIAGVTDDQIQITPKTKESLTKDNAGTEDSEIVGHGVEISVNGLCYKNGENETAALDLDDLMELNLKKGDAAKLTFVYTRSTGKAYTGTCIPNGYTESTNSEDFGGFSQNFKVIGDMTPVS